MSEHEDWPEWFQTFAAEVPIKDISSTDTLGEKPPLPEPANDREPD